MKWRKTKRKVKVKLRTGTIFSQRDLTVNVRQGHVKEAKGGPRRIGASLVNPRNCRVKIFGKRRSVFDFQLCYLCILGKVTLPLCLSSFFCTIRLLR